VSSFLFLNHEELHCVSWCVFVFLEEITIFCFLLVFFFFLLDFLSFLSFFAKERRASLLQVSLRQSTFFTRFVSESFRS